MAATARPWRFKRPSVIPGFGLTFGFAVFYLSVIVIVPLAALLVRPWELGLTGIGQALGDPRVLAAMQLSFSAAATASAINAVFGLLVAWILVRYEFPGRRVLDAFVDLPFALPTAIAGIALTSLYAPNGWIGRLLVPLGIEVTFTPVGIIVALTFVGLPFVVRSVQPVLEDLDREYEEVAATLGATRLQAFARVVFPAILPAWLTGVALAFARAVGEYGSVIFIAGNIPMVSEIAPLLIVVKLEQYDYAAAAAIGAAMLAVSFAMLLAINALQAWARARG